jgi:hypothetical protein
LSRWPTACPSEGGAHSGGRQDRFTGGQHDRAWSGVGARADDQACDQAEPAPAKAGVDRLLSNEGIDIDAALRYWVPHVVDPRTSINVAIDWTEFDADGQATLMLSLLTRHSLPRT